MSRQREIEAAAKWWADVIQRDLRHDNGDAEQSVLANCFALKAEPEQAERFRVELVRALSGSDVDSLVCDYHPCPELRAAADAAGIKGADLVFPFKTRMYIEDGSVKVSHGYRAPYVEVLP